MALQLKACPFCGGAASHLMRPKNSRRVGVGCMQAGCPASQAYACGDNYKEAYAAWNTRALDPRVKELEEALRPFAVCPTHGKNGGRFVIAHAVYEDMTDNSSAPREAYWHKSDFDRARTALHGSGGE